MPLGIFGTTDRRLSLMSLQSCPEKKYHFTLSSRRKLRFTEAAHFALAEETIMQNSILYAILLSLYIYIQSEKNIYIYISDCIVYFIYLA